MKGSPPCPVAISEANRRLPGGGTFYFPNIVLRRGPHARSRHRQRGYLNFTAVPSTTFDDENELVYLVVDLDEGKQFYVSSIEVDGVPPQDSQKVLRHFLLPPGQVYKQRLLRYSMKRACHFSPNLNVIPTVTPIGKPGVACTRAMTGSSGVTRDSK